MGIPQLQAFPASSRLVTADAIGMELELEGFTSDAQNLLTRHIHPLWRLTQDGSLRNGGIELITNGGLGGQRLIDAFERLSSGLERVNYDASFRCSTHMHINMLDFTVNQVVRFLLVYTACEPVLFTFCGAYRESSNFCTPVTASLPFHRKLVSRMYDNAVAQRTAAQFTNKYTAMNLAPLFPSDRTPALGTVEFRGGRPLVTMDDMLLQANLLLAIKEYVRSFQGTEDELLASLAGGLNNTVYNMGIAAGINTHPDRLENALIHSWCLLKSYQESMKAEVTRRGRSSGAQWDHVPSFATAARGSSYMAQDEDVATIEPLQAPVGTITSIRDLDSMGITERVWPSFHRHFDNLQGMSGRGTQIEAFNLVATSRHLSPRDRINILTNWLATKHVGSAPYDFELISAMAFAQSRGSAGATRGVIPQRTFSNNVSAEHRLDSRCDYSAHPTAMAQLASIFGVVSVNNGFVWRTFERSTVRLKNCASLRRACAAEGYDRISRLLDQNDVIIPATKAYAIFRILGVGSLNHIHSTTRALYDKVAAALQILGALDLNIPVVLPGNTAPVIRMLRARGTMGLCDPRVLLNQSTPTRVTLEGHEIY